MISLEGAAGARMAVLAVLWGSTFLWIKVALNNGLAPVQITFTRCALGAVVLLSVAAVKHQPLPRSMMTWRHLAVAALFCNAVPFALFSYGEQTVDSGVAGVVHATTPLWSVAIGIVIGSDRGLHPMRIAQLVLGFWGRR